MSKLTNVLVVVSCFTALNLAVKEGISAAGYRVNWTDSLPRGIYQDTQEPITYGTLVTECLPQKWAELGVNRGWISHGSCANGAMPILKKVVGMPGDTIVLTREYVAVNGKILLGTASLFLDSQGREIPHMLRGTYVLGPAEFWLMADNIVNSWDSRYTGPAARENIKTTVRPVWVEAANNE